MSPERRLSKGIRKQIRAKKAGLRKEVGLTHPELDSSAWTQMEEILRLRLSDYGDKYAPHTRILREFFEVRREIKVSGFQQEKIRQFQEKHDRETIISLKDAFVLITRTTSQ